MCQWVPLILSPSGFVWVEPFTHSRSRGTPSRVIRADIESPDFVNDTIRLLDRFNVIRRPDFQEKLI